MNNDNEFNDDYDDLHDLEVINYLIPRRVYVRSEYFDAMDNSTFFKRFRLSKPTVLILLEQIENQLEYPNNKNNCISPINQLLIFLRFCATCGHLSSLGDFGGMHLSSVSRIIKRVSVAVASLRARYIKFPENRQEILSEQLKFYQISRFPKVLGALDCTHVKIQSPGGIDGEIFRNRKGYFSLNVQVICNANLEAMDIVARWPGSSHDATIFNNSRIRARFENGDYPHSILLGDGGYGLRSYLMTPLLNPRTLAEQRYNHSHIRTRNPIERFFGVIKRRFPVLAYGCRLNVGTTMIVVVACAVLHNLCRQQREDVPPLPEDLNEEEFNNVVLNGQIGVNPLDNNLLAGNNIRNIFINDHFTNV